MNETSSPTVKKKGIIFSHEYFLGTKTTFKLAASSGKWHRIISWAAGEMPRCSSGTVRNENVIKTLNENKEFVPINS